MVPVVSYGVITDSPAALRDSVAPVRQSFYERLNGAWHQRALQVFMAIVLAHWAEHLAQALQVYALHWPMEDAGGVLGLWFPWLVASESLHYGYALVMLVGLWILRGGFVGSARFWWMTALYIQFWHHIEHALLQAQVIVGHNLFGSPVPISIAQLVMPRLELHLIYNTIVFVPMIIAVYRHLMPSDAELAEMHCTCAVPNVAA